MTSTEQTEFLNLARTRYQFGRETDADDRKSGEDDNRFAFADDKNLDQWEKAAKAARKKRPIIQWNRIPTFHQQVANDGRQNRPSIKISPGDEEATKPTAEYFTARIRHIEYESNVDTAKDCARDQQILTGRGFLRVSTEWIPGTQKQRICVDKIDNQFSVVWDPSAKKYDRSDADWCFVVSLISKDEHRRRFGEVSTLDRTDFADVDRSFNDWINVGANGEMVQVAEYWLKEWTTQEVPAEGKQPARKEKVATIKQYIINGAEILEETKWLGSTIPIVPFWGKEAVVDGQRRTFSLIRNAKSPQRSLNLAISNLFEQLGQQSKTPWIVPAGAIAANHESDWANVHVTPLGYLIYQQWDSQGRPLNAPTRNTWEPAIQALVEAANFCIDAIKAAMGIFDASLGNKGNETSGIAIQRRQKESDVANYHFPDNEARSNKYLGEILVELIPIVDREGSIVPVRSENGKTHLVPIGKPHEDWKTGETVTHDLLSGQYGVYVSTGPSYDTARQEDYDRDSSIITAQPEAMWVMGDLLFRSDDSAGAEERADRWKRAIDMKTPGLIQDKGQSQEIPPQVQQALQAKDQELQQTQAFAQSLHEQIQTDQVKAKQQIDLKQLDIDFQRWKVEQEQVTARAAIASKEDITHLQEQIAVLTTQMELSHEAQQAEAARAHAAQLQQSDQVHADAQQDASQQHATELQESGQQAAAEQQEAAMSAAGGPSGGE